MNNKFFTDFYTAFHWLKNHPKLRYRPIDETSIYSTDSSFPMHLDIQVVKVNPETEEIDDNDSLNTATRVWLEPTIFEKYNDKEVLDESDKRVWQGVACHDWKCDCGGATFEEAILEYANLFLENYGNYDAKAEEDYIHKFNLNFITQCKNQNAIR